MEEKCGTGRKDCRAWEEERVKANVIKFPQIDTVITCAECGCQEFLIVLDLFASDKIFTEIPFEHIVAFECVECEYRIKVGKKE